MTLEKISYIGLTEVASGRLVNPSYKVIKTVNEQAEGRQTIGIYEEQMTGISIIG